MRAFLIVLDSVGIGEAPDASEYGDTASNTLANLAQAVSGLHLPILQDLGLGNIPGILPKGLAIQGVPAVIKPKASFGALCEVSKGKDTTTGHWEMAGLELKEGFRVFPSESPSFPVELIDEFEKRTGRKVIGNKAASGTEIIDELGSRQMEEACWIIYTSADSVFQVAAHEDIIPLEELYRACTIARTLCNDLFIGRVIARPYIGRQSAFRRTANRRDYSCPLPEPSILDRLHANGTVVTTVGKLDDIFDGRGITEAFHAENNTKAQSIILDLANNQMNGFIFANLIDFDMRYGHRRDCNGYAKALEAVDSFFGKLLPFLNREDLLIVTADHGNDPTFKGTDHTREFVPLLVYRRGLPGKSLGIRNGFYDIAQSLTDYFHIRPMPRGKTFLFTHPICR